MREGYTRAEDTISPKLFKPLQGNGPTAGVCYTTEEFEHLKDEYYRLMGWNIDDGNPTEKKLSDLGIEWVSPLIQ
jgi:aldehyde:ferredoxin oxidoreductase